MLTSRSSKRHKTVLPSLVIIAGLLAVAFFFGKAVWGMYVRYEESNERRARAEEEYATLHQRLENMQTAVASFGTREGKEAVVRESFNLAKEGEEVAIILDKKEVTQPVVEQKPWYKQILNSLKFWE